MQIWTTHQIQTKEKQIEGSFNDTDIRLITTKKHNIEYDIKMT